MNLMANQDKKNISANNPDEPKDALGFEVALVGSGKKMLLLGERENDLCRDHPPSANRIASKAVINLSFIIHLGRMFIRLLFCDFLVFFYLTTCT